MSFADVCTPTDQAAPIASCATPHAPATIDAASSVAICKLCKRHYSEVELRAHPTWRVRTHFGGTPDAVTLEHIDCDRQPPKYRATLSIAYEPASCPATKE